MHQAVYQHFDNKYRHELVKLLVENGANVNEFHNEYLPIHHTLTKGEIEISRYLAQHGSVIDIFSAAGLGELQLLSEFIDKSSNLNVAMRNTLTPLHYACANNQVKAAKMLLDKGANVNCIKSKGDETPLHSAAMNGSLEAAILLLSKRADVNEVCSTYHEIALHLACTYVDNLELVLLFINAGANINQFTKCCKKIEDTPLHLATENGNVDTVKILLAKGADVTLKNGQKKTCIDVAKNYNPKKSRYGRRCDKELIFEAYKII